MKKKWFIFLILILTAVLLFFYFKPQPVDLEFPVCTIDGEVAYFKISASWYRHWNGKRTLEGKIWIDDMEFHSILSSNWKEHSERDVICRYISNQYDSWGMPRQTLTIQEISEEWVYLIMDSQDKEGTTQYIGPANTAEEYSLLYQKWLDTWFVD